MYANTLQAIAWTCGSIREFDQPTLPEKTAKSLDLTDLWLQIAFIQIIKIL